MGQINAVIDWLHCTKPVVCSQWTPLTIGSEPKILKAKNSERIICLQRDSNRKSSVSQYASWYFGLLGHYKDCVRL